MGMIIDGGSSSRFAATWASAYEDNYKHKRDRKKDEEIKRRLQVLESVVASLIVKVDHLLETVNAEY